MSTSPRLPASTAMVCEGRPLRRLDRFTGGLLALLVSWAVALALHASGVHRRPDFGRRARADRVRPVLVFLVWRGWPVAAVGSCGARIAAGNALVLGGATATYAGVAAVDLGPAAAGPVVAMLFEGWIGSRAGSLATVGGLAAALYVALRACADPRTWTVVRPDEWVAHATLNAVGVAVILHVAIGRGDRAPVAVRRRDGGDAHG